MEFLLVALVLLAVIVFVTVPLRRPEGSTRGGGGEDPGIADLEARKEAKYREIRDAQLDHEGGKITEEEWRRQDAELRREAIAILKELDARGAGPDR